MGLASRRAARPGRRQQDRRRGGPVCRGACVLRRQHTGVFAWNSRGAPGRGARAHVGFWGGWGGEGRGRGTRGPGARRVQDLLAVEQVLKVRVEGHLPQDAARARRACSQNVAVSQTPGRPPLQATRRALQAAWQRRSRAHEEAARAACTVGGLSARRTKRARGCWGRTPTVTHGGMRFAPCKRMARAAGACDQPPHSTYAWGTKR